METVTGTAHSSLSGCFTGIVSSSAAKRTHGHLVYLEAFPGHPNSEVARAAAETAEVKTASCGLGGVGALRCWHAQGNAFFAECRVSKLLRSGEETEFEQEVKILLRCAQLLSVSRVSKPGRDTSARYRPRVNRIHWE